MQRESTVVFVDLTDSTRLLVKLGDFGFAEFMQQFESRIRDLLQTYDGTEIDKTDGFLAVFASDVHATRFALACQRTIGDFDSHADEKLQLHIGLHRGNVVIRHNIEGDIARGAKPVDVDGICKVTAARLMSLAMPGQILATREIFDGARASGDQLTSESNVHWVAHGHYVFDGFDNLIEIFEIGQKPYAPLRPPPDNAKVKRSVSADEERTLGWRPARGIAVAGASKWILDEKLGQGGYGEVWSAHEVGREDNRSVFKFCFQTDKLRALKREAALFGVLQTALSERDDIARVLAWNLTRYPYYLQLEYSDLPDLHQWVDQRGGWGCIPLEDRLELIACIADAVDSAHQAGVLHKDIKPSNVLAGGQDGQIRVVLIDFGVGMLMPTAMKIGTISGLTESGGSSGTGIYMAPELREGKPASIRSDVYSLGVILFQAIAGDFSKALAVGWESYIRDPFLRDAIAKCVDGRPEMRPHSVAVLAELLRSLPERREAARLKEEVETAERLERQRAMVNARRIRHLTIAVTLLLFAGSIMTVLAVSAHRARNEADMRLEQALRAQADMEVARRISTDEKAAAENLVGFMLTDLSEELKKVSRLELLDGVTSNALAYFDRDIVSPATPDQELLRAQALIQLGELTFARGRFNESRRAYDQARIVTSKVHEDQACYNSGKLTADCLERLGQIAEAIDIPASTYYTDAMHLRKKLWLEKPSDPERIKQIADIHERMGYYWNWTENDPQRTGQNLRNAFRLRRFLIRKYPDNPEYRTALALSFRQYGMSYNHDNQYAQVAMLQKSLNLLNGTMTLDPQNKSIKFTALDVMKHQAGLLFGGDRHRDAGLRRLNHIVQYTKNELVGNPDHHGSLMMIWNALMMRAGYYWTGGNEQRMMEDLRDAIYWSRRIRPSSKDTFHQGTELGIALGLGHNAWRALSTDPVTSAGLTGIISTLQRETVDAPEHASSARVLAAMELQNEDGFEEFLRDKHPDFTPRWPDMHLHQSMPYPPFRFMLPENATRFWKLEMVVNVPRPIMLRLYKNGATRPYYATITRGFPGLTTVCSGPQETSCWVQIDNYPPRQLAEFAAERPGTGAKLIITIQEPVPSPESTFVQQ